MSPPRSEQLIRDYLNRLSMAARGQLSAEDRRGLVDRTTEFIEQNVGDVARADPRQVAALLARLGDPAVIAELEYSRLAVIRGEIEPVPTPGKRGRAPAVRLRPEPGTASWHWPRAAGHPRLLDQILTAVPAAGNGTGAGYGVAAVPDMASNGAGGGGDVSALPAAPASNGAAASPAVAPAAPASNGAAASPAVAPDAATGNGAAPGPSVAPDAADSGAVAGSGVSTLPTAGSAGSGNGVVPEPDASGSDALFVPPPRPPADAVAAADADVAGRLTAEPAPAPDRGPAATTTSEDSPSAPAANGSDARPGIFPRRKHRWPTGVKNPSDPLIPGFDEIAETTLELEPEPEFEQETDPDEELATGPVEPARARAEALLKAIRQWTRGHPLEATAAFLMGIGGLVYPPVWIAGALLTFAARTWDYRDRWIALALPVLLVVVGAAAGISLGSRHAPIGVYVHEGWVYADILSRILAVLSAYYLVWRVDHPRRIPVVPPWNRPHKVG
jgi:hypothetical protein